MRQTKCRYMKHSIALLSLAALFCFVSPAIAQSTQTQDHDTTSRELASFDSFMDGHPEITENPNSFMRQEKRFDAQETRKEMGNLDRFMDTHPEIAEQLRKDPSLVNNKDFVSHHPALQEFLQSHSGVAQELRENPNGFMGQEQRFDQREINPNRNAMRWQMGNLDQFLDSHPEIAEQLRKDPSLVNNKEFVEKHPALQQFLAQHPGVREEYKENPNAF